MEIGSSDGTEDFMEDHDDVKKDLLNRVKHLTGENESTSGITRLNFGIMENETKGTNGHSLMKDLNIGGGKNKFVGKSVIDKGYVGIQEVKDRPKRSPLKQRNKAVDTHGNKNHQKCDGSSQSEVENASVLRMGLNEYKMTDQSVVQNNPAVNFQRSSEGISLSTMASQHQSDSPNSGGKGLTLGSFGSTTSTGHSLGSLSLSSNHLTGKEGTTGISLNSLASNHLSGTNGLTSQVSGLPLSDLASDQLHKTLRPHGMTLGSQASGLSLRSMASNHLSGSSGTHGMTTGSQASGLSLSSLASNHLSGPSGTPGLTSGSQASGLSLSSLASNHLSGPSGPPGLITGLSLSFLATNHLASSSSLEGSSGFTLGSLSSSNIASVEQTAGPKTSQFTIPAIFGPKLSPDIILGGKPKERSVSPEVEIDLMSALKLSTTEQESMAETKYTKMEVVKIELIVPDISRIRSQLRKRKRSSFSKVITRKWARTETFHPVDILLPTNNIPVFQFDEPSPDDIVTKAQSQSKAFNRPSPVRQARENIKT